MIVTILSYRTNEFQTTMLFDEYEYYNIYQLTVIEFHIRLGLNSFNPYVLPLSLVDRHTHHALEN